MIIDETTIDAWRCTGPCKGLMYNVDEAGKPIPGAPRAYYVDETYPRLCNVCYDMLQSIKENSYMQGVQRESESTIKRIMKNE